MSIHGKTALILLGTLVLGIIIGVLLGGPIARHHLRHPFPRRGPEDFGAMMEMIIDPDETQREAIRDVLDRHSHRFMQINSRFRDEMSAMMDSLRQDLSPILTEEQQARLDERHGRLRGLIKKR
jgi:hypothetical protein